MKAFKHNKALARQDGTVFDFTNIMQGLHDELITRVKPLLVACHVCDSKSSVRINPKRKIQTVNCTWCKNTLKFRILPSGVYKVKSSLGIELVNGEKRSWIIRFDHPTK